MTTPSAEREPEYGIGWRLRTAALAVGVLAVSMLFVPRLDLPAVFAIPGIVGGAMLVGASLAPRWQLGWRGEERGAWELAGALGYPLICLVFTAYGLWLVIASSGWVRLVPAAFTVAGAVGSAYALKHALAHIEDPDSESDE